MVGCAVIVGAVNSCSSPGARFTFLSSMGVLVWVPWPMMTERARAFCFSSPVLFTRRVYLVGFVILGVNEPGSRPGSRKPKPGYGGGIRN